MEPRPPIIDSLEAAQALFAPVLDEARDERILVAHLDQRNRLIRLRSQSGLNERRVELAVRAIIGDALTLHSATLILAHNHPSGDPTPSAADIDATRTLVQVARALGISVRDHIVFGGGRLASFRARGLL